MKLTTPFKKSQKTTFPKMGSAASSETHRSPSYGVSVNPRLEYAHEKSKIKESVSNLAIWDTAVVLDTVARGGTPQCSGFLPVNAHPEANILNLNYIRSFIFYYSNTRLSNDMHHKQ